MDEFKLIVVVAVLVSLTILGTVIYIAEDAINNVKAPDIERGLVVSKSVGTDRPTANYSVTLSGNKTLYIQSDKVLYDSILENQTFVFGCRIDYNNKIILIESVNPQGGLVTSKNPIADKSPANFAVNLASGRTLYIANNATLYDSIMINQTYLFDCHMDYNKNIYLINGAQLVTNSNP